MFLRRHQTASAEPPLEAAEPGEITVGTGDPTPPASRQPLQLAPRRRGGGERFELLFVGDTDFGETYQEARERRGRENILKTRGYDAGLAGMRRLLARADLVVANLETPVTDLAEPAAAERKAYVHKASVEHTPAHLRANNILVTSLANNHALDYGPAGLAQSLDALWAGGITCIGAGLNAAEAAEPLMVELRGDVGTKRVAIFAAYDAPAESEARRAASEADGPQIGVLDVEALSERIRGLKAEDPGTLVVVFPHWGRNYAWRSARQRRLARSLFAAGADLILGHGAHMLQELDARDGRAVAYSLGNFLFNSPGRYARNNAPPFSLVARLTLRPGGDGWRQAIRLYPIVTDNRLTNYKPRLLRDEEFDSARHLVVERRRGARLRHGRDATGHFIRLDN
jgi:poly-gamma-glutamate capsule biosynthesis protein CapA/YwtB (metallophosphatase superfamily)